MQNLKSKAIRENGGLLKTYPKWIWYPERQTYPNSFAKFRKIVTIDGSIKKANLMISADSRYKLYINGQFIKRGPAPYDPRYMYYDKFDAGQYLKKGENIIAILGYYIGISTREYVRLNDLYTTAGVLFRLELTYDSNRTVIINSDKGWKTKKSFAWKSGTNSCGFSTLSMNEIFDSRRYDPEWLDLEYDDSRWKNAYELEVPPNKPTICSVRDAFNYKDNLVKKQYDEMIARTSLVMRDIEFLVEEKIMPEKISHKGSIEWLINPQQYFDTKEDNSYRLINKKVINEDYNPEKPLIVNPGKNNLSKYYIFDFKKETFGRIFFELEAQEGAVVEVLSSEVLIDDFISPVNNFNFWSRYICCEGRQSFELFEPMGFRYVMLIIRENNRPLSILKAGANSQNYPFSEIGKFECSDKEISSLWDIGKLTQKCVSQDIIFDNPMRERTQYSYDPEFNMLGIYYQFGEYKLARKSLIQLAQSQGPDGNLLLAWPCGDRISRIKEAYLGYAYWKPEIFEGSFHWLISLWNYYLFSGDLGTLEELYPAVKRLLKRYEEIIGDKEHIFTAETWFSHFYGDHVGFYSIEEKILGGNMFYKGFIDAIYNIAGELGDTGLQSFLRCRSDKIKNILIEKHWSRQKNGFFIERKANNPKFNILINVYSLLFDIAPGPYKNKIAENIKKYITPVYPSPLIYGLVYFALAPYNQDGFIQKELKDKWAKMYSIKETGTFSEMWSPDLDIAVRCQNAACPNYILPALVLGVYPLEAGFRRFEVRPDTNLLEWAKGIIPTPKGEIHIQWEKKPESIDLRIKAPDGFEMENEKIEKSSIKRIYKYRENN